jgi:predicted DNA-binding protein (MmcQ/YjbR family)
MRYIGNAVHDDLIRRMFAGNRLTNFEHSMDVTALKLHCSRYPYAEEKLSGPPANVLAYTIGGKQFAYFKTSEPEKWRFSVRATPERFLELTGVSGVKPARYMARFHWVTIVDVRTVPADYLKELVAWSYNKALTSLTKRQQAMVC